MQAIVSNFRCSFSLYLSVYHIIHMRSCVCVCCKCVCFVIVLLPLMHSFRIVFRCEVLWSNLAISKYSMFIFELLCTCYSWICYVRSAFAFQSACYTYFVIFFPQLRVMRSYVHICEEISKKNCVNFTFLTISTSPSLPYSPVFVSDFFLIIFGHVRTSDNLSTAFDGAYLCDSKSYF